MNNIPLDLYCERMDASFWAEPLNAISNGAFLLAALFAYRLHKRQMTKFNGYFMGLLILVASIGVGSFLFHTFANRYTEVVDTVPIWAFVVMYVWLSIRIIFKASIRKMALIMSLVMGLSYLGFNLAQSTHSTKLVFLNGSLQYAPAVFFLLVFTITLHKKRPHLVSFAMSACGLFLLSLFFRTIDIHVCESFSMGSHFLWHSLNGMMLYFLLKIMHEAIKENTHERQNMSLM